MKYEEIDWKKIPIEELKITRYGNEEVVSKESGFFLSTNEIKEISYFGDIYKRDKQCIEIDWLGDNFVAGYYFYDTYYNEKRIIILVATRNEKGELEFGFSDHND